MKSIVRRAELPTDVVAFADRVERWRSRKKRWFEPMPESLWREALELARRHGPGVICRASRLHYGTLCRRLKEATRLESESVPVFVELSSGLVGASRDSYRVVLERVGGEKMTAELYRVEEVLGLASVFLRGAR